MIATIVISVILAALLGLAVWYMVRTTRRGGCVGCSACSGKQGKGNVSSGCGGNCAGCSAGCGCHSTSKHN